MALVCALSPAIAGGHDSQAPPGAPASWLPAQGWVLEHWLPYSDADLQRVLRTDAVHLGRWISDRRTLADLARRRGLRPSVAVDRLVAPWRGRVSPAHFAELRSRAMRTFTQGHLAVHMFYHPFHDQRVDRALPSIVGVAAYTDILQARAHGISLAALGARHGRSERHLAQRIVRIIRNSLDGAVRRRWTTRAHERTWLAFIRLSVRGYLRWAPPPSHGEMAMP